MKIQAKHHRQRPKIFSQEEKQAYYLKWKNSGQSKTEFCQSQGITKSAFYTWCHQFKQEKPGSPVFSPVTLKMPHASTMALDNIMQLEICLPNQTKILLPMQQSNVLSFIQELCHAARII